MRRASRALSSQQLSDSAVHTARKDLKRSRTALRLLRPALGERVYRREDAVLRAAAHSLNAARDARVLTQTLQSLRQRSATLRGDAAVSTLLRSLQAERAALRRRLRAHPAQLAQTRLALERLCERVDRWPADCCAWSMLGPALGRIYRRGRGAMPSTRPRPTDRSLHEWRKQVKYLRYALEILAPLRARKLTRLARQAEKLSDSLGEAHDLAILAHKAHALARGDPIDLQHLLTVIDRRRARLTLDALERGETLYQARPADWERTLWHYWRRWQRAA